MQAMLGATLRSITRLEAAGFRAPRLTEADHARFHRFRRKLGWGAFVATVRERFGDDEAGA